MSLTDLATIKKLIQAEEVSIPNVFNERIVVNLFEDNQLQHTNIDIDSESVKIIRQATPSADSNNPITLTSSTPINLDSQKIVWDTVTVSADLGLTTIYTENLDYIIDYFNGIITRSTIGSSIVSGSSIYVWYLPFTVLNNGSDYNFNYDNGTLNRRAGTTIPQSATLFVDYSHSQSTVTDLAIYESIAQAEAFIEPRLKSPFTLSSDNIGLKAAATSFTMHILCLSQTFKELNVARRDESDDLAKEWYSLSDKYLSMALSQFSKYLKITSLEYSGLIQNRFPTRRKKTLRSPHLQSTERPY